jgi:hypothetical protein
MQSDSTDEKLKDKSDGVPAQESSTTTEPTIDDLQLNAARQQGTLCGIPLRVFLVVLSCLGLAIGYADRSNIAIAIIPMSKEFGWNPATEGAIFSCFFYGYMATQILGGYLADRFGGKYIFGAGMNKNNANGMVRCNWLVYIHNFDAICGKVALRRLDRMSCPPWCRRRYIPFWRQWN